MIVSQLIINEIKLYLTKATDLWSFWITCWKAVVNLYDFYSLIKFVEDLIRWPVQSP